MKKGSAQKLGEKKHHPQRLVTSTEFLKRFNIYVGMASTAAAKKRDEFPTPEAGQRAFASPVAYMLSDITFCWSTS